MRSLILLVAVLLLAAPAYLAADHHASGHGDAGADIVDTAAAAGQFETLLAAAEAAGLVTALQGDGPLTVFAPTDDAFGALPAGTIESLLLPENRDRLADILKFHVVAGRVGSNALIDGVEVPTLAGIAATITATESGFAIENARVVSTDIGASNGVVHVIDRVILPPERMSRREAAAAIDMAISRGVPMFNGGNPGGTVAVYSMTARSLMSGASLSEMEKGRLQHGLSAAMRASDHHDGAWQLRYALDDVQDSLQSAAR